MGQASASARQTDDSALEQTVVPFIRQSPLGSLFGRAEEISAIVGLLNSGRSLVTVTGPGGVGKTRLALAVSSEFDTSSTFPGGGVFVTLAPVADVSLVISTVAHALGVVTQDDRPPVERLIEGLQGRKLLLILDNLEHVLGASLDIAKLLNGCPELTVLATSRRALRLSAEQEFPLSPLSIAKWEQDGSLAEIEASPAIALFLARASAANVSFSMTESNAADIVQICSRLDGLPLAIELAAARVKLMSPKALLSRLSGRLQLLTSGPRDVPRRQQTLRDAIAWSYDLLSQEEQALFRRLSVFAGGATLDAIAAVASDAISAGEFDALDLTAALVDHSLLVQEGAQDGEPRFRMLETLREFAFERLDAAAESEHTRDAHARFFTGLAERAAQIEYGPEEAAALQHLGSDLDNIRAALTWLVDGQEFASDRARLGLRLAGATVRYWDLHGYVQEETHWLNRALAAVPEEASRERRIAVAALGVNAWFSGHVELADVYQQEALAIGRALGDKKAIVESLWFIGLVASQRHDVARLEELAAEAEPRSHEIGIILWRTVPDTLRALAALINGDPALARTHLVSSLSYHKEHGFRWPHAWVQGILAEAEEMAGNRSEALRLFQASLSEFHEYGDVYSTLDCLSAIAHYASTHRNPEVSARLLGTIASTRAIVGKRITWPVVTDENAIASTRAALVPSSFDLEFAAGRSLSLPQAVALAISVRPGDLSSEAPPEDQTDPFGLSPRERDVLRLLVEGKSNDQIGTALFISPRTAGTHVANILGKLDVHSRSAAVGLALSRNLV